MKLEASFSVINAATNSVFRIETDLVRRFHLYYSVESENAESANESSYNAYRKREIRKFIAGMRKLESETHTI